jgi:hypothetical protein
LEFVLRLEIIGRGPICHWLTPLPGPPVGWRRPPSHHTSSRRSPFKRKNHRAVIAPPPSPGPSCHLCRRQWVSTPRRPRRHCLSPAIDTDAKAPHPSPIFPGKRCVDTPLFSTTDSNSPSRCLSSSVSRSQATPAVW